MKNHAKSISLLFILAIMPVLLVGCSKETKTKYPRSDITFLIPSGAGGGNDSTVRALLPGMEKRLGVSIIAETKPASNGMIAAMEIINGNPDGHKLYFNSQTLILMPYNGMRDIKLDKFQPVAQVVEDTAAVMVKADSPYRTIQDLIRAAKERKLKVGHNGVGAIWHLASVLFADEIGAEFQYISYPSGGNQMLTALAVGDVDFCVVGPPESKKFIDAGKIRALVVLNDVKSPVIPNAPISSEVGLKLTFPVWRGIFTTAGLEEKSLEILDKAVQETVESEEFKSFAKESGFPIKYRNHKEFSEFIGQEISKYDNLMKEILKEKDKSKNKKSIQ